MKRTKSALMKWMARSLVRLIPMGESAVDFTTDVLPTMSEEVYGWWTGKAGPEERREELESLVQADKLEVQSAVDAALEDAAQESGVPIDPEKRDKMKRYLEQVPDAIRRSMRRPGDSHGRTVPPHLAPRSAVDLAALLPQQAPRFKAGDRPIPGVDIDLVSALGAGGFGEVWRARKTHLGQDVALKFCLDPEASASLRNETSLLRRLMGGDAMHPGIVRLLGTYNDCTALEYEFVEGPDLAGLIREWHADGKRPTPKQVIDTVRQIAEVVAFAHQLDPPLVHRDLKPANILVQRKPDGSLRFRLTDFGIGGIAAAKQVAATQRGNAAASAATSIHGSYSFLYASPQQMRAERPDPSDDVYSLGVIFWQLANGDLTDGAPGGTSWTDDLKAEGYPPLIITTIARCFDHRADRRPKNAAVLAEALKTINAPPPMPGMNPTRPRVEPTPPVEPSQRAEEKPRPDATPRTPTVPAARPTNPQPAPQSLVGETKAPTSGTTSPRRKSSAATWWIVGFILLVLLLISCLVSGIIIAALGTNQADEPGARIENNPTDPRLQGWHTLEGDAFVSDTTSPQGPVLIVQNGEAYYVVHQDGSRVQVVWNSTTNMWQDAQ